MREAATRIGIDLPSIALGHFLIGLCSLRSGRFRTARAGGLAAGRRRAAVGHTRAPRLPFRRQPCVSLPGSSVVRRPQLGWADARDRLRTIKDRPKVLPPCLMHGGLAEPPNSALGGGRWRRLKTIGRWRIGQRSSLLGALLPA